MSQRTSDDYGLVSLKYTNANAVRTDGAVWFTKTDATYGAGDAEDADYLFWDATNRRLGVGTNEPEGPVHVKDYATYGDMTADMSSNTAPSPYVASASTEINTSNQAWNAFDRNLVTRWQSNNSALPAWVKYDFSTAVTAVAYRIIAATAGDEANAPKDWTFEGSNDNSNWTTLDTQTGAAAWTALEPRLFTFSNSTAYRYYRLSVSTVQTGGTRACIVELEIMKRGRNVLKGARTNDVVTMTVGHANDTRSTYTTAAREIRFEQTGDTLGASRFYIQNRAGSNGMVLETDSDVPVDMKFSNTFSSKNQSLRLEGRNGTMISSLNNTTGEFQFLNPATSSPYAAFGLGGSYTAGPVGVGIAPASGTRFLLRSGGTGELVSVIRGFSGQTANLTQWQDSSSTVLSIVTKDGYIGAGTSTAHSYLQSGGSVATGYRAITALRTLDASDHVVDCTSGTFTVTLPTASGITGREYTIKNTGTGVITVDANSTETIDGALTVVLNQYESATVVSNGTNWIKV